jgi:FMN-dependent NADH-azoreductase
VKLLEIQSSPRGESSDSITLTKSFIEACKSGNNSIVVDTLNVWHESLPEFDYEAIGAKYKAVKHETMTEAESNYPAIATALAAAAEVIKEHGLDVDENYAGQRGLL